MILFRDLVSAFWRHKTKNETAIQEFNEENKSALIRLMPDYDGTFEIIGIENGEIRYIHR